MKNPIQPIIKDKRGCLRFKANAIVRHLLDNGGLDLNDLAQDPDFNADDWQQFAQLIGYSLEGYSELSYVDDLAYNAARLMATEEISETQARIAHLEAELAAFKEGMRDAVARLYEIHPDDLKKD